VVVPDQAPETAPAFSPEWKRLEKALEVWIDRGNWGPLGIWINRELSEDGLPIRMPVSAWWPVLEALAQGWPRGGGWPIEAVDRVRGLVLAALRWSRPDGSAVFGPSGGVRGNLGLLRDWAERLDDPSFGVVADWWAPGRSRSRREPSAPPLPAFGAETIPLAMLRADWSVRGDLLSIDQRDRSSPCLLELNGGGRRWLGPTWGTSANGPARPTFWATGPQADLAEWTVREGPSRVVRTALLFRGRKLALLAEQVDRPVGMAGLRLSLPAGVVACPIAGSRAFALTIGRATARVLPLGLPPLPSSTDRGTSAIEDDAIHIRQAIAGRRGWLPVLVSWDAARNRRPVRWRPLTVTERMTICPPEVAFAVRVAWGPGENLVIYRSLGPPRLRAFLGHQTGSRFLAGRFTKAGDLEPWIKVD
jgi:hypothetical protein